MYTPNLILQGKPSYNPSWLFRPTMPVAAKTAVVDYPASASYTRDALHRAFSVVLPDWQISSAISRAGLVAALQFSDYDAIDWDLVMQYPESTQASCYCIRKVRLRNIFHGSARV